MSEVNDEVTQVGIADVVASDGAPDSLFEQLRQAREATAEDTDMFLAIPGYKEKGIHLYAKYQLLDGTALARIGRKVQHIKDRWQRNLLAATDTIVASCTGMYVDLEEEGNEEGYTQLTADGTPINGYSDELAAKMNIQSNSARGVVFGMFAGNELAVVQHSMRLQRWMGNTNLSVDEDFPGEI